MGAVHVTLHIGKPIRVPAKLRGETVGEWTAIVTQAIDATERRE